MQALISLYLNRHPFSLPETERGKQETGNLIRQYTHPDTGHAQSQRESEDIGSRRTDQGHADGGSHCRICRVSRATQAAHVNDLGYLEQHDDTDAVDNVHAICHDAFLPEEHPVDGLSAKEVKHCQSYRDSQTDAAADGSVALCLVR